MKALLIYPCYPDTFWSFKHALWFVSKKAAFPPLGLLTVASMLPDDWEKKVVDMNVSRLKDKQLDWADIVFISAMIVQRDSAREVIERCKKKGVKVVAGGPLFSAEHEDFDGVDHFVLYEAEASLPRFLHDLENNQAASIYSSRRFHDLERTPMPQWDLINLNKYNSMNIQYSRGCPYHCEFCDIPELFGRKVRTKSTEQVIAELDAVHSRGYQGNVFFVDDNFIGNRRKLKREILPAIIEWQKEKARPFEFLTEASIDLADDDELLQMMAHAGFTMVFIGIESPNEESLAECGKNHNIKRDLMASVKKIQEAGLQVTGGFIVGFDHDPPSIFDRMVSFIQNSGIVTAMVGLLEAPKGTKLYQRLKQEGRLTSLFTGDNTSFSTNIIPKMGLAKLISGHKELIGKLYSPGPYYKRVKEFLKRFQPKFRKSIKLKPYHIGALLKSIIRLGVLGKERLQYWKLFFWAAFRRPTLFPMAITLAIYGRHFRTVFEKGD